MEEAYLNKAKAFIRAHLKDEFSLNELAESVGYSAFHLARAFKGAMGVSIMEYARNKRILAASKEIEQGRSICDIAMDFCFDTHAGFTKAFTSVFGCAPAVFQAHARKMKTIERGITLMEDSKIVIRHICKDDVQDLWENVYSAMTPRQITEDKIIPAIEGYKTGERLELVAVVDGKVVMSLPMTKAEWVPLGFLWDNNFIITGGDRDVIMQKLMDEMKIHARHIGVHTLISPQGRDSESSKAMQSLGFQVAMQSGDWEYLMMAL